MKPKKPLTKPNKSVLLAASWLGVSSLYGIVFWQNDFKIIDN